MPCTVGEEGMEIGNGEGLEYCRDGIVSCCDTQGAA